MTTRRLTMTKTREILRQKWVLGRSDREVGRSLGISAGVVGATLRRAEEAGLTQWDEVERLDDAGLEERLYGRKLPSARPQPNFEHIHTERSRPGVTLQLLHHEYLEEHPYGYQYTRFCDLYRDWLKRHRLSMRQIHKAGEKMFVDFAGQRPNLVDPSTGEVTEVELFVAVLGASSYTYAEAVASQKSPEWIRTHTNALEFFGGSTEVYVPDQLKSGVTRASRYEPDIQRTYREMAAHYGAVVIPARPYKPKDKAKVEVAVQVAERWILAVIRNETFSSLTELNARISELLEALNNRKMRAYGASRRELYERLDKPALRPLPRRSCTRNGRRKRFTSTTTSRSRATSTPCPTSCDSTTRRSRCARRWRRSKSTPRGGGSRRTGAGTRTATRPTPSTCPSRTGLTWNGRRSA